MTVPQSVDKEVHSLCTNPRTYSHPVEDTRTRYGVRSLSKARYIVVKPGYSPYAG